jgi:hypothetical protein
VLKVRAGFRAREAEVLAGGPVVIDFFVKNFGRRTLHLAVATDRSRLRPDYYSFEGCVERGKGAGGQNIALEDPLKDSGYFGGPASVMKVEPGGTYSYPLLVNDFLRLELALSSMKRGEAGMLRFRCRRPLPLAANDRGAFRMGPKAPVVEITLSLRIRRDERALGRLIEGLADDIRTHWPTFATIEFEGAISKLTALRIPAVVPALRTLVGHPDGGTRWRAMRALAIIEEMAKGGQSAIR